MIKNTSFLLSTKVIFFAFFVLASASAFALQPYLEDADTTTPPAVNPASPSIAGHEWPRLMISSVQSMTGNIERYSKYNVIATQAGLINRIAELQNRHPNFMYFRMVNPHEYLSYGGEDDGVSCSQSHGNPFESTTATTGNCGVYAGHWLYQPGTPTRAAVTSNTTTIPVQDASRFDVGQYVVIYNAPAGSFNNAEHMRITGKNTSAKTLTVQRGYKSTAKPHGSGSIVAQHALGNSKNSDPRNWIYNLGTNAPRDGANRRYIDYLPLWMSQNYKKDRAGNTANVTVSGFVFDTEFHFEYKSKKADINNDLVQDNGISAGGTNWWGDGFDAFHAGVRSYFPNFYIVGGFGNVRGFDSLNGVQMEGFPIYDGFRDLPPDYSKLGTLMSRYSLQMRHRDRGAPHNHVLNKVPTRLYPYGTSANSNAPFRFSLGLALLEDGYYGHQNDSRHPDMWFDEYAVDVTPGSSNYGRAVPSNPNNESQVRAHRGWLGQPLGLRQRLYDDAQYAPGQSRLQGGHFESSIAGWTGTALSVSRETSSSNVRDGSGSLRAGAPSSYKPELWQAQVRSPRVSLSANTQYTLVFSAKASKLREIEVSIGGHGERYMVGTNWQRHVMSFKTSGSSNDFIRFNVGRESTVVWLDSVYVFPGNPNVFRRDFDNGIVVINATPSSRTVNLGGTFKRIQGTQDAVNNGATLSSVTIPAYDSALLVRPDGGNPTDTQKPVIQINAPTRTSTTTITDTTIVVTDNEAISASKVEIRSDNSAGVSNYNCNQTNSKRVDCSIHITSSGILRLKATDQAGNVEYESMSGYQITSPTDTQKPVIQINAPTRTSTTTITDTTVVVTDNEAISASKVEIRSDNSAGVSNYNCNQTNSKRVDCSIHITSSGILRLKATDQAGNVGYDSMPGYEINGSSGETGIQIIAPTRVSNTTITNTTIIAQSPSGLLRTKVSIRPDNTAGVSNFNCTQTSNTRVDCTIHITSSGILRLKATDQAGNVGYDSMPGYEINGSSGETGIQIIAPTRVSNTTITNTTIIAQSPSGLLRTNVSIRPDNTAGVSNFNCTQTSNTRVDCTIHITSSGILRLEATDQASNVEYKSMPGYEINGSSGETGIQIIAPTRVSNTTITNTTIIAQSPSGLLRTKVSIRPDNTAGVSNFNCTQTSNTRVDCTIHITSSGILRLEATDQASNVEYKSMPGYIIQ